MEREGVLEMALVTAGSTAKRGGPNDSKSLDCVSIDFVVKDLLSFLLRVGEECVGVEGNVRKSRFCFCW